MGLKFLITGGLGHIGSKLIREYAKREDVELIRILDNFLAQRYCSLFDLPQTHVKYEFIEADIRDIEKVKDAMKNIDIVIHLASVTDAPSTINDPQLTHKVIFEGAWDVVNIAMQAKVKKFFYASTTSVYGEAEGIVDENSPEELYKPASPYAESKRKTEKLLQRIYQDTGFPIIILRKGTIFGTSIGMRFHTAVNKFCYLAAMNKPLTIWDSALNSKRPYLGLNDCIRAYEFLEKYGKPGEIYNVITNNFEMKEIIDAIKSVVPDVRIEITKSPLLNQKSYHVGDNKIRELGFVPKDDLQQNIKETVLLFKVINNRN
ncbi:NAD-dependent epimerase/dehydratase family protein [Candidatus Pacearchaeota archaeon]|nr:NAD-dependent epimerase/dehydratase family protein [Candidatus Pacearchaeota archaeon]